ncbi:Tetratricopeptide repeat superfamily protein [Perilla frutescens var. hirtella]|uniref:Tetratricopeptide repeat superfamily protein n=1 Tax=Perilla frutescens var. hirtella TaxID=608512 RepID=A0AAD4NYP6_PERFH|nr:Tetratricopeptide repeat superfamily protein [Perilla frutescens var. hirtella]KAH6820074.1 Tetratricopeptide repeat superfamily protein [Perilla frutescens var. hirtella]
MTSRKLVHLPSITPRIHNSLPHRTFFSSSTHFSSTFSPKPPSFLATNVIKSYFEAGLVDEARNLFDEMPDRDVVAWSAMISGYTSCNRHTAAWTTFRDMLNDVQPNDFTFSGVLKACKGMSSLSCGAVAHGLTLRHGFLSSIYVSNALVDMYAGCCSDMGRARAAFEEIGVKNSVSWTSLIAGYTHLGDGYGGLEVFRKMLLEEGELNPYNVSIAIRACTSIGSHAFGKQIHAAVLKHGFESNIPVMNSVIDMYCRCISLSDADRCFHEMIERDIITWNTMIAGCEKLDPHGALSLYSSLMFEGLLPNCFTFTSVVAAVANIAVLGVGEQVHGGIVRRGLEDDVGVANSLIDMYAKCGSIASSCKIFRAMHSKKNVVSWTSMMVGYGSHGHGKEAVALFDKMVRSGVRPDRIVFVAVLNACSHTGLVDEGLQYFKSMVNEYTITPDQEIYGCIVDLLGRAGRLKEAYELIEAMPFMPDESVWGAFLGACKAHKLAELGNLVASRVLNLRPSVSGTYVALASIYAANGKWGDFARVRRLLKGTGSKKETGRSWIEVKNEIYSFVAGDKLGSHIDWVYEAVDMLGLHIKDAEYDHDLQCLDDDLEGT